MTDGRLTSHTACHEKGSLEESIENGTALSAARRPCIPHLAVDLRFAKDHRVEAGRNAKKVRDRVAIPTHVSVAARPLTQARRQGAPDRGHGIAVALDDVELRAIACREEHLFARPRFATQRA